MADREACERRVYRLALLLTGNERAATGVTATVVGLRRDLHRIGGARLDRLTVLRSREARRTAPDSPLVDAPIRHALGSMPRQQLESWVFHRVFQLPLREMSRAMDCSVTATERHLDLAEDMLEKEAGVGASSRATTQVRQWILGIDVPVVYRRRMVRKRRTRLALRIAGIVLILAVIGAAVAAVL